MTKDLQKIEEETSKTEKKEKVMYKKSELLAEQKELITENDKLVKELQEREYEIYFKDKKIFDRLLKFLEKDAPWGHTTATGLIMLYHNMKQQKEITQDKEWDGKLKLRSANISILWTMVTKMTGSGFYEAKAFVELMAVSGESLSKAVQQVHIDNTALRETHQKLSVVEDRLGDPTSLINDVPDEDVSGPSLEDEVNPIIENS